MQAPSTFVAAAVPITSGTDWYRLAATGGETHSFVGLNEVLVERSSRYRLVRLEVFVGQDRLAEFSADGVIVATPTGSTAYALSAGGPIVSPRAECLIVVPVSAHMIMARPFVFAADETVRITVKEDSDQNASLVLDGALGHSLPPGCPVEVGRHPRPLRLVRLSKALGDEKRLRILRALADGEKSLMELAEMFGLAKTTMHHHMIILRSAGLVAGIDFGHLVIDDHRYATPARRRAARIPRSSPGIASPFLLKSARA